MSDIDTLEGLALTVEVAQHNGYRMESSSKSTAHELYGPNHLEELFFAPDVETAWYQAIEHGYVPDYAHDLNAAWMLWAVARFDSFEIDLDSDGTHINYEHLYFADSVGNSPQVLATLLCRIRLHLYNYHTAREAAQERRDNARLGDAL